MSPLVVEKVVKRFRQGQGDVVALEQISLEVRQGEFLAIMGASGSGKSTLLHLMAGLTGADDGRVLVNGFPTGVEVSPAMNHGGPFPATSDGRSTSVGTQAILRFVRPICYQDFPNAALPPELQRVRHHLPEMTDPNRNLLYRASVGMLHGRPHYGIAKGKLMHRLTLRSQLTTCRFGTPRSRRPTSPT